MPSRGTLFGAWVDADGRWTNEADAQREAGDLEQALRRTLAINHHYYAWTDRFPTTLEIADRAYGRRPLITWEPWGIRLDDINRGRHDAMIRQRARDVAAFGSLVYLRWGHEMNSDWYPWSGFRNGKDPKRYVKAFRRIRALFDEQGARNVAWVWSPNHESVPNQSWNDAGRYYPGDDVVDWVGIDGFNWGRTASWSRWTSFATIFGPLYRAFAGRKPIMIAETGSVEAGGSKAAWFAEAWKTLVSDMPAVRALVLFDDPRFNLRSSPEAFDVVRAMANHEHFTQRPDEHPPEVQRSAAPTRTGATFRYQVSEPANTAIAVRDGAGRIVRYLKTWSVVAPRAHRATWNGTDAKGKRVAPGRYRIIVSAWDASRNRGSAWEWVRVR